jgi:hypothetical protein
MTACSTLSSFLMALQEVSIVVHQRHPVEHDVAVWV